MYNIRISDSSNFNIILELRAKRVPNIGESLVLEDKDSDTNSENIKLYTINNIITYIDINENEPTEHIELYNILVSESGYINTEQSENN